MVFTDRAQAGRVLAERLTHLRDRKPVVVGITNGGVVTARAVAAGLDAPLDVVVARKLAVPGKPAATMGAVAEHGVSISKHEAIRRITLAQLIDVGHRERALVPGTAETYRRERPALDLTGQIAILVDDGIVTGSTVRAAIRVLRIRGAGWIVLGVPVAPRAILDDLARTVDQVICLKAVRWMRGLHQSCLRFPHLEPDAVVELLREQPPGHHYRLVSRKAS
jgi:predicted phosphoribosyltransferase